MWHLHRWDSGKQGELQPLVKCTSPSVQWTHCVIVREALASKQLSPELNDVMADITATVSDIKTRPVKADFCHIVEKIMESDHTAVLFHRDPMADSGQGV